MVPVKYSIVIPVYNRPHEVRELLQSLVDQTHKDFEVILVDDGSDITCKSVYEDFADRLKVRYFFKPNSGPGPSRNFGFEHAMGKFFVVFDSDCILPSHYFSAVEDYRKVNSIDAWGGPDKGHGTFTATQQAMAYTMASMLTTGGIRGARNKNASFQPRSFNMGMSREVFERTGGFHFDRYAEDIELSIRIKKEGFKIGLIPDAFVYHKRRTTFKQFFNQVYNFGRGRVLVGRKHKDAIKITHWFPAAFTIILISIPFIGAWIPAGALVLGFFYLTYLMAIATHALKTSASIKVAVLSVPSALVQLTGYGLGFISEKLKKST